MTPAVPPLPAATGALAVRLFLAFSFAYFFSALLRAITATLAPAFSAELHLGAAELGLMAGAYFLGFAATQLPLGSALDRLGPKRVLLALLSLAVLGCLAFAVASSFGQLLAARMLIGLGVSACLMAPLTSFRHRLAPPTQLRLNSWMLMTGSFGMLASTLPVQWLLPLLGWRGLFAGLAGGLMLAMLLIQAMVPRDPARAVGDAAEPTPPGSYRTVFAAPAFRRMAPMGFFCYGGLVALQSLWIGPWLTQVAGAGPMRAAQGLFVVNLCMLFAFLGWGLVMPRLVRAGWPAERIIGRAWPAGVLCLLAVIGLGERAGAGLWALWCVCTSVGSLSQPALAQHFPPALAGRALSAFNLLVFGGVFSLQWGIGLLIDLLVGAGWSGPAAFRGAMALFLVACVLSFAWFRRHGDKQADPGAAVARG